MLEFNEDAIVLSGITGTKLKCQILGGYYPLWWSITSGGKGKEFGNTTSIIEMNAGTGEDYIEETRETILGSSGKALALKAGQISLPTVEKADTSKLKVILVEENGKCYEHLKNVIKKRWPALIKDVSDKTGVYLFNYDLKNAVEAIEERELGNSLFFFDPLLYTPWSEINHVAERRIKKYYQIRTEFIVFLFTSDWFKGRGDLACLPTTSDKRKWTDEQKKTVGQVNDLFGHDQWQSPLLNTLPVEQRMSRMVGIYKNRLHKWFRYVLPMPFEPKVGQTFHLFMCSNYEEGVKITRLFYTQYTGNPSYSPDNPKAYAKFIALHPEKKMKGNRRSDEWKMLWAIITKHDEGIADIYCSDLREIQEDIDLRVQSLEWLKSEGYLKISKDLTDAWSDRPSLYRIDLDFLKKKLDIDPPHALKALSPK